MKKIFNIILILILIMPFGFFLNVDAIDIDVYDNKPKSQLEQESKQIKNKTNIIVRNIGYKDSTFDEFIAYKILNAYYNDNTNEISYGYTDDFQNFLDSYNENLANDVGQYFKLTSDDKGDIGTVNKLVSDYAINISNYNLTGTELTSKLVNGSAIAEAEVEVGVYLILPTSVTESKLTEIDDIPKYLFSRNVYGVMIANAVVGVTDNTWSLEDTEIVAKMSTSNVASVLAKVDINDWNLKDASSEEIASFLSNVYNDISVSKDEKFSYFFESNVEPEFPANGNRSILNNETIMNRVKRFEVKIPEGFEYDFYVWDDNVIPSKIENGKITITDNDYDLCDVEIDNGNIIATNFKTGVVAPIFDLRMTDSVSAGNHVIRAKSYYIKDPYFDVDRAIAKAKAEGKSDEEALESVMDEIIGEVVYENTITTYGVRILTTSSDNNDGIWSGVDYAVCKDINCTEQVSDRISFSEYNNKVYASFVGISGESDYYLKQIKAPTGYKLFEGTIKLLAKNSSTNPDNSNIALGQDNYYEVAIVNEKNAILPFTGGVGTVIYTVIGLFIVGLAFIIYIEVRKDRKAIVKEEGLAKLD